MAATHPLSLATRQVCELAEIARRTADGAERDEAIRLLEDRARRVTLTVAQARQVAEMLRHPAGFEAATLRRWGGEIDRMAEEVEA